MNVSENERTFCQAFVTIKMSTWEFNLLARIHVEAGVQETTIAQPETREKNRLIAKNANAGKTGLENTLTIRLCATG